MSKRLVNSSATDTRNIPHVVLVGSDRSPDTTRLRYLRYSPFFLAVKHSGQDKVKAPNTYYTVERKRKLSLRSIPLVSRWGGGVKMRIIRWEHRLKRTKIGFSWVPEHLMRSRWSCNHSKTAISVATTLYEV